MEALEKERHCKKVALRRELDAVDVELAEVRRRIEKEMRQLEQGKLNKAPLRGSLLCTYVAHIVTRSVVEVSFMMGTSVGGKTTIPTAPSGYTLLLEKQGNGPNYPLLNASSAFMPIQGDPGAKPDTRKDGKEGVPSPTEQNSNSNNTSSETRSPPADKQEEPEEQLSPHHECAASEYPTLPMADTSSCTTLSGIARKSRRVSPPWNCSTVVESNGSDNGDSYHGDSYHGNNSSMKLRSSCVGPRTRVLSRSDIKRPSGSHSPDSAGELSSVSRHSRESTSPTASSPNRRVSAASSSSSRRAPTDLQI
ncbi:hypothetical protein INR49_010738 [Caranx melampygus]|nr:hypothetical protein INR49_010738 [Caranx melampygus]